MLIGKRQTSSIYNLGLLLGPLLLLFSVFAVQFAQSDAVYAQSGTECWHEYERAQEPGSDVSDYVLVYLRDQENFEAPEPVCGSAASGSDVYVGVAWWPTDAGWWFGDNAATGSRYYKYSALSDDGASSQNHYNFYEYRQGQITGIMYLEADMTAYILDDDEHITVHDPMNIFAEIENTQNDTNPIYSVNPEDIVETGTQEEAGGPQCVNEGGLFGFFACSMLTWVLDRMVDLQTWLVELLFETEPLAIGETNNAIYQTWSNVRNIANSLLIIAFMAIIFSLAMSLNVDAYTVKRMVPRLLMAVVTIQASYFISAIMVDLTNILGGGLQGLTDMAMRDVSGSFGYGSGSGGYLALAFLVGGSFKAALLAAPAIGLILLILFIVMLGAFLILALRDLFIIAAVVLSPIAFLANLLPGTERWFKFWWSNFARLLLMYPFIVLMIQLGNLGAYLLIFGGRASSGGFLAPFMAILMQAAAIISIYFAFRVGGSLLSLSMNGFQKMSRAGAKTKAGKGLRDKVREKAGERKLEYAAGARGGSTSSRGGKLARGIMTPSAAISGGSRAQAVADFKQKVGEAGKNLEAQGFNDPRLLNEFAEHGGSQLGLASHINSLKSAAADTDDEDEKQQLLTQAERLQSMSHFAGNKAVQSAALKRAATQGAQAKPGAFEGVAKSLGKNKVLRDDIISDATFEMKSKGAVQYLGARADDQGTFTLASEDDQLKSLRMSLSADAKSVNTDSLKWYAGMKDGQPDNLIAQEASTNSAFADTLRSAMPSMNAEQRSVLQQALGPDTYKQLNTYQGASPQQSAPQGTTTVVQPSGGAQAQGAPAPTTPPQQPSQPSRPAPNAPSQQTPGGTTWVQNSDGSWEPRDRAS